MDEHKRQLRKGYTTGTCAAAASGAAAAGLLGGDVPECVEIMLPAGSLWRIGIARTESGDGWIRCGVKKDSGDDPDVTNGVLVYAEVRLIEQGIVIEGGAGIGRVTKPGLACPVGEAAINPVPRRMIEDQLSIAAEDFDYEGGFSVEISIPAGAALAQKTFNPNLGIVGGISVLGTSGIVEPMSDQALIDTIKVEINMRRAAGEKVLILTPGNYGETFLSKRAGLEKGMAVKCSNFIGDSLEHCRKSGFDRVLLVGHLGKLIKVAAGVMNTHSKFGDRRMEIMSGYLRQVGADDEIVQKIKDCVTTEDAVDILRSKPSDTEQHVMSLVLADIQKQMKEKLGETAFPQVIVYTNVHGTLGETTDADSLIKAVKTGV